MTTYITRDRCNELLVKHGDGADGFHKFANAAIQAYRDSLVAGVVLPEPTVKPFYFCNKCGHMGENGPSHDGCDYLAAQNLHIYTADQLRQAIADALEKQVPQDCRLCANYTAATGGCTSVVQCVDASQFRGTLPRRYWTVAPELKDTDAKT